jgi:hypothetical protein
MDMRDGKKGFIMTSELDTGRMKDTSQSPAQLIALCAITGKRVTSDNWQQITVVKDEGIWWKCPECANWHIILMRRDVQWL